MGIETFLNKMQVYKKYKKVSSSILIINVF